MRILRKRNVMIIYVIAFLLMITGSFFDEQISTTLYNQNNLFARGMASFGEFPFLICLWSSAMIAMRIYHVKPERKYILITVLSLLGGCVVFAQPLIHLSLWAAIVGIVIEAALGGLTARYLYRRFDLTDIEECRKVMGILLLTAIVQLLVINVVKIPWGRPRFRTLVKTEGLDFTPWWKPGFWDKGLFAALGIRSEEFKSFPSGHTGDTATILSLIYLTRIVPAFAKRERLFTWVGLFWIACMMVSRIMMGAHFLTDVTMGFTVTFTAFVIIANYMDKEKNSIE